ncbi:MAG: ImmA/IrrE family metallo-endopeptidase [Lachnospiraceae bacterium]|nr:ImmA/IrrE family metallo-endopeptidase [Lachnospiraceae bacterium]
MEYVVEAKTRKQLRELAHILRRHLGVEDVLYFPIVEALDVLSEVFPNFSYEVVEDTELARGTHADTDVTTGHIRIKESVCNGACEGVGRDRMTIAHEIGHFFTLCFCGFKLQRNYNKDKKIPAYKSPEWQAKCFAGELMIPSHLVSEMSPNAIAIECGVSLPAAKFQFDHLNK